MNSLDEVITIRRNFRIRFITEAQTNINVLLDFQHLQDNSKRYFHHFSSSRSGREPVAFLLLAIESREAK
jgi:hypothetical protein